MSAPSKSRNRKLYSRMHFTLFPDYKGTSSYLYIYNHSDMEMACKLRKKWTGKKQATLNNTLLCLRESLKKRTFMHHFERFINSPALTQLQLEFHHLRLLNILLSLNISNKLLL
jgi:hypothetical protein